MTYKLHFSLQAFKALEKINEPHYSAIKKAIQELTENPRPYGYKKLVNRNSYRIRSGDYRVTYEIFDSTLTVDIINLGHRKEIYD